MIAEFRARFNRNFRPEQYARLLRRLEELCGTEIPFRVAETPVFLPAELLEETAQAGARLARRLLADEAYLAAARRAIPAGYRVAGETARPHFLTADFALVREKDGALAPKLVEMQAFPSVYGFQTALNEAYCEVYGMDGRPGGGMGAEVDGGRLGSFLGGGGLEAAEAEYWRLLRQTIVGRHDPENVVLAEVDPLNQKTRPDFEVTARRLGIAVVDISSIEPEGNGLTYRNAVGKRIPIARIYNRAIVDELIARRVELKFDLERAWEVEWAGHPNWYFLMSKFSIPYLCRAAGGFAEADPAVPPAVFLGDFLAGPGRRQLEGAGVALPAASADAVYAELLLKPLFSFAGKGIEFEPTQARLEAIPEEQRGDYLLQQRMSFVPTIETPHGATQAEIRILYLWPDDGELTPVLSLIRLGRGRMMGVDHNRNQEWVGASGAFFPAAG